MVTLNFTPFPTLTTERLVLRQLRLDDAHQIHVLRSDDRVNLYIKRAKYTTVDDAIAFVERMNTGIANNQSMYWAVALKTEDKLIGTICLWNFSEDKTVAEIGYELQPDFQKKGIMQEGIAKVLDYAFNTIGLQTIEACVNDENENSVKLLVKNNFRKTGQVLDDEPDFMIWALGKAKFIQ